MKRLIVLLAVILASLAACASAEVVDHGHFRVAVNARLAPNRLPRHRAAPVRFSLSARFLPNGGSTPPQLRHIEIKINRHGQITPNTLPACRLEDIQPAKTSVALETCRSSLVGEGRFSAQVRIPSASPFPSAGKLLAFNGSWHGHPAILAHIYGPKPVPSSYTIPFLISTAPRGTYGTTLSASLPRFSNRWGYVTAISLRLGRPFSARGRRHSYLTAACSAPSGLSLATFPLTRASFVFAGHQEVRMTLTRSCRAK